MAADRRRFAWMNAVLALLVVFALLFASAAGVQAMECHERPVHRHSGLEHSSVLTKGAHVSLQGSLHTADHKGCCAVPCGFCIVLASMDRTEAPAATGAVLRFPWGDQAGSDLALPPTLGPPRLPA